MTATAPTPAELDHFRSTVETVVHIPDVEWQFASRQLSRRHYPTDALLVQAGDVVDHFYFILSGLTRFYYTTEDGKEFNKHFARENEFAGSMHSLVLNAPCGFSIQALEPTHTIALPNALTRHLYDRHPCWERLGRLNAERLAIIKEQREKALLLDALEVRYRRFLEEYPDLPDRMAQYHIASFLGVTDVALSRIRRRIYSRR